MATSTHYFLAQVTLAVLLLTALLTRTHAETAPCRFENNKCSCKYSPQEGGICLSPILGSSGNCRQRPCQGGWSCECAGRTHLCNLSGKRVFSPAASGGTPPTSSAPMPCTRGSRRIVSSTELALGFVSFGISFEGVVHNDCNRFSWFLNGEKVASFDDSTTATQATGRAMHRERVFHDKLELRRGDVISFRFTRASYYCFTNSVLISVNSSFAYAFPSKRDDFEAYYNRQAVQNWKSKNLVINAANSKSTEALAGPADWIQWRVNKLTPPHEHIADRSSHWNTRDDSNLDNRRGNWYFRLRIPLQ